MFKTFKNFALLALPVLLASACGGDTKCDPLTSLLGCGDMPTVCPMGTTLFRVQDGNYTVVNGTAFVQDNCTPPLTAADFTGKQYAVKNDLMTGTITVTSVSSGIPLGSGPVQCNNGVLSYSAFLVSSDGNCNYKITDTSNFSLSADNTFTLDLTETISDVSQVLSKPTCTSVKACSTKIKFQASKPVQ